MSLPLPIYPDHPEPGARGHAGTSATTRPDRLAELVRELLPVMRLRAPHLPEPRLVDAVARIAANRLADEELAQRSW